MNNSIIEALRKQQQTYNSFSHLTGGINSTVEILAKQHQHKYNPLMGGTNSLIEAIAKFQQNNSFLLSSNNPTLAIEKALQKTQSSLLTSSSVLAAIKKQESLSQRFVELSNSNALLFGGVSNVLKAFNPSLNRIDSFASIISKYTASITTDIDVDDEAIEIQLLEEVNEIISEETSHIPETSVTQQDLLDSETRIINKVDALLTERLSESTRIKIWKYLLIVFTFIGLTGDYITITDKTNDDLSKEINESQKLISDKVDGLEKTIKEFLKDYYHSRYNYRDVNLRTKPKGKIITVIPEGSIVEEIEIMKKWLYIKYTNHETGDVYKGYVFKKYFKRIKK